ncbi:MAG: hypothetical protein CBC35_05760 [Planctomycetes bacterium TMED75]|nr:MAG: hypothetical protein CBC35_05760 [Planctomycetes bacterium TMED75]
MIRVFYYITLSCLLFGCAAPPQSVPLPKGDRDQVVAFVFTSVDCPIANAMAPQLRRTITEAESLGVKTYLVYPRVDITEEAMATHARAYGLEAEAIADPNKVLVTELGATVTPEGVVIKYAADGDYEICYRGRLNDLYPSIGNRRDQASCHEFRDAILASRSGQPIATPFPPAIGCMIERVP